MSRDGQRDPKGRPKGVQGHSKGNHRSPKDAQREPKGSQRSQKEPKVGPGGAKGAPKTPKGSQRERYMLKKSRGVFFVEVAEAPQAAATQTHRAGRPETGKKGQFLATYDKF